MTKLCPLLSALLLAACGGTDSAPATTPATAAEAPAAAAEAPLPDAATILDGYVEATGGREAHLAIETLHTVGTVSIPKAGIEGRTEVWQKAPSLMRMEMKLSGVGDTVVVIGDGVGWESSAATGTRLLSGEELTDQQRDADLHGAVRWREHYPTVKTVGREEVAGVDAYQVELTPASGETRTHWYAVDDNLLLRTRQTANSPMGAIEVTSDLSDYRPVAGIQMPFRAAQSMMGNQMVVTIESVDPNVEIPADRFAPSAEVQELLDRAEP